MSIDRLAQLPAGPILLVADNGAIASRARAWALAFKAAGRPYRVRLAGPSTPEAIEQEARSLGAVAIISAGTPETHALGSRAAAHLGLPCARSEILHETPIA